MHEITLKGSPHERGILQGKTFARELGILANSYQTWLGDLSIARVAEIQEQMVGYLRKVFPDMVLELEGIAAGSGLSFDTVCTINFVSAIGALGECTSLVSLNAEPGPVLAKTSDIGDDYEYYTVQEVHPTQGYAYLAIGWAGTLWAEVGINSAGLAVGQSSAPIQLGQIGAGLPTLQYPRLILERCSSVAESIEFCRQTPMAGKGLNIAVVDEVGSGAVVEKSGTATAMRYPLASGQPAQTGASAQSVYSTNIFLDKDMQGFDELAIPGIPSLTDNSRQRLEIVSHFLQQNPKPTLQMLETLMKTPLLGQGLCQQSYAPLMTHFAYLLIPGEHKLVLYEGVAENRLTQKEYFI